MQYEEFCPKEFRGYRQVPPRIRINSLGTLTINATGLALAGWGSEIEAVILGFDKINKVISLRAATQDVPNAIKLNDQGRTKTCGVTAFCKKYDLLPESGSINIELTYEPQGDMLLADYNHHKVSTRKRKQMERSGQAMTV